MVKNMKKVDYFDGEDWCYFSTEKLQELGVNTSDLDEVYELASGGLRCCYKDGSEHFYENIHGSYRLGI